MCAVQFQPSIRTERLTLRSPAIHDAVRIADLVNDYDVARMLSRVPHPYALADAESFVAATADADPRRQRNFLIEHPDVGPIGLVGLHPQIDLDAGSLPALEIGYWLGRTFWGRGFATEAVSAAMAWARDTWDVRVLVSGHFVDNPASGRVLEKAGFLYTGQIEPRLSFARSEMAPTRMMVWLA